MGSQTPSTASGVAAERLLSTWVHDALHNESVSMLAGDTLSRTMEMALKAGTASVIAEQAFVESANVALKFTIRTMMR